MTDNSEISDGDGERFLEEIPIVLSGEDRDIFLAALDKPPEPNEALKRLMSGEGRPKANR